MKSWRVVLMAVMLVAAPLGTYQAFANTIDVGGLLANSSFEAAAIGSGTSSTSCPTSWTCAGALTTSRGIFFPTSSAYTPGSDGMPGSEIVPDGNQVAFLAGSTGGGGQIFQTLTTNYQTGNIYNFTFWY